MSASKANELYKQFRDERIKELTDFINNTVCLETNSIREYEDFIKGVVIRREDIHQATDIMNTSDIPFLIIEGTPFFHGKEYEIPPNSNVLKFYIQYSKTDFERKKVIDHTLELLDSIKIDMWLPRYTVYNDEDFKNHHVYHESYYRYIFHLSDMEIISDFLELTAPNMTFDFHKLDIINSDLNINGLFWFDFHCKNPEQGNMSHNFSLMLKESYISYFYNHYHPYFDYVDKKFITKIAIRDSRSSGQGYRKDLKKIVRSSWEANIARILNYKEIDWEYEKEFFALENSSSTYTPDFFLQGDRIIEIKGLWDDRSIKKIVGFTKKYSDKHLFIIDEDMYYSIANKYSSIIDKWEKTKVKPKSNVLPVVGITDKQRKPFVQKLKLGDSVVLEREPTNSFDRNAIKVLDSFGNQIGYISADWALIYSSKLDLGMIFKAVITEIKDKVIKISVTRTNLDEEIIYDFLS